MMNVCHSCAVAITNDDFSAMCTGTEQIVRASIEAAGYGTLIENDPGGYFDCWFCNETSIGISFLFEQAE